MPPHIDRTEVRLLWHADYWDGPRSGMLLYCGEECWFQIIAESEDDASGWFRQCAVLRLSTKQHAEEVRWHVLFRDKVGAHTEYDEQGQRRLGAPRQPRERWKEFYDVYPQGSPPDFTGNEVLGGGPKDLWSHAA
jgi:hypothetical protein